MDERVICMQGGGTTSSGQPGGDGWSFDGVVYTLNTVDIHGVCFGISRSCLKGGEGSTGGMPTDENIMPTMTANGEGAVCYANSSGDGITAALDASYYKGQGVRLGIEGEFVEIRKETMKVYPKKTGALCANSHPGSYTGQDAFNDMLPVTEKEKHKIDGRKYELRRLTTTECARLQGFPDWWTDGAKGSDSNIYKMWGNGIALPCAADVIGRLARELEKERDEN